MKWDANLNLRCETLTFVVGGETLYAMHDGAMVHWEGYAAIIATVQNDYKGKIFFSHFKIWFCYFNCSLQLYACVIMLCACFQWFALCLSHYGFLMVFLCLWSTLWFCYIFYSILVMLGSH